MSEPERLGDLLPAVVKAIYDIEPPLHRPTACPVCRRESTAVVDGQCLRCRLGLDLPLDPALCNRRHYITGRLCPGPAGCVAHSADGRDAWNPNPKETT